MSGRRKSRRTGQGARKIQPNRRKKRRNRPQRGRSENQPGKESMSLPSEKPACPSRRTPSAVRTESGRRQTERGSKGCWDAEQPDRDWPSGGEMSIASQLLLPGGTRPRTLCARQVTSAMGGDRLISRRWWCTSCIQARWCALRLQSREAVAGQIPPGADATARSPDAALPLLHHSIDTARATDKDGHCECWLHTRHVGYHRRYVSSVSP